jgi:hypothetical protein
MFRVFTSSLFRQPKANGSGNIIANLHKNRTPSFSPLPLNCRCYSDLVLPKFTRLICANNTAAFCLRNTRNACRKNEMRRQRLSSSESPFMRRTSNVNEDDIPPITLDNTIRMKNVALATVLMAGCLGIMWYSMHAVGQAGEKDDPLSALKMEAAEAQKKHDHEQATTANAADMLEKFQKGEYDPDHVSEEEEEDGPALSKKPWWKVW